MASEVKTNKVSPATGTDVTLGDASDTFTVPASVTLDVNGTIDLTGATTTGFPAGVPTGCILMWSGAVSAIPSGWVICDGNNSTPNLTSRFVIHADADSGGSYDVDDTGGSTTSGAHTLSTAEMPSHTHTFDAYGAAGGVQDKTGVGNTGAYSQTTAATGGGGSHTHGSTIPPYLALAYIMKT